MLYWLAQTMDFAGVFNLVRYLSFRAGATIATALIIGLLLGPRFIGWLRVRQGKGQPVRHCLISPRVLKGSGAADP